MTLPHIQTIFTLPSFHAVQNQLYSILRVGLQLSNGRVYWGDCQTNNSNRTQHIIEQFIAPRLVDKPIADFYALCRVLETAREPYQYEEVVPEEERIQVSDKNRRKLWKQISGQDVAEPTRIVDSERPLPPSVRYGVSQALWQACLAHSAAPAMLGTAVNTSLVTRAEDVTHTSLFPALAGVSYVIQTENPAKQLGKQAEKLQGYLRQLGQWLSRMATAGQYNHQPAIVVVANGALGKLYEENLGRILGAISGLEQAVKPYPLFIMDPLVHSDRAKQLELTKDLLSYLRIRKYSTQILVSHGINTLSDVTYWVENKGAHGLGLQPNKLGELSLLHAAAEQCHASGTHFALLSDPDDTTLTSETLTAVAHTINPRLYCIPPTTNQFLQTDRWQKQARTAHPI